MHFMRKCKSGVTMTRGLCSDILEVYHVQAQRLLWQANHLGCRDLNSASVTNIKLQLCQMFRMGIVGIPEDARTRENCILIMGNDFMSLLTVFSLFYLSAVHVNSRTCDIKCWYE